MQLHHLALRTPNLNSLVDFYEKFLGLKRTREQPNYSVWLSLDTAILMIEQATETEPSIPVKSRELIAFSVDKSEQDALRSRLTAHDIAIEEETAYTIYVRDPDGRRIGFSHFPLNEYFSKKAII